MRKTRSAANFGGGYATAPLRIEHRPQYEPFSREYVIETLDFLKSAGIRAWWCSVAAPHAIPLFKSRYLPCSDLALGADYYQWLTGEAHRRGIAIFSHFSITSSPLTLREHPDWSAEYLEADTPDGGRDGRRPCFSSPFRELIKQFAVEVLGELGFDGFWFDCAGMANGNKLACVCPRCTKLYRQQTGRPVPQRLDYADLGFRQWVRWRQDYWMGFWAELTAHVRRQCPHALLAFNGSNRLNHDPGSAVPLRAMPEGLLMANEVDWRPNQALLQMKYQRSAMRGRIPPETWLGLSDGTALWQPHRPEPDPAGMTLFGLACMTGGGYPSQSGESDSRECIRATAEALNAVAPYVGGKPVALAGLVVSEATNTFAHRASTPELAGKMPEPWRGSLPAWRAVHGMHYILDSLHLPSETILDDQLTDEGLAGYPVVVLSDIQCLADDAAAALERYVRSGGVLLATGATGMRDELGTPRQRGALDDLLGIVSRDGDEAFLILEDLESRIGAVGLPKRCMISGKGKVVSVAPDVTVLVEAQRIYSRIKNVPTGNVPAPPPAVTRGPAVTERRVGKGVAMYLAPNVGFGYSENPNPRSREVIKRLVLRHRRAPYEVEAPWNVAVTAWQQGAKLVFHVLNQPAAMCRLDDANWPSHVDDVIPTGPVTIRLKRACEAIAPAGGKLTCKTGKGGTVIRVPRIERHMVIVCQPRRLSHGQKAESRK